MISVSGVVQVLLIYLGCSALVGLALTYYFDNPGNAKLMTILQVGLQLLGLLLVALSTNMPEASLTFCCLLIVWKVAPDVMAYLHRWESDVARPAFSGFLAGLMSTHPHLDEGQDLLVPWGRQQRWLSLRSVVLG